MKLNVIVFNGLLLSQLMLAQSFLKLSRDSTCICGGFSIKVHSFWGTG
jgi:hypothetical protein